MSDRRPDTVERLRSAAFLRSWTVERSYSEVSSEPSSEPSSELIMCLMVLMPLLLIDPRAVVFVSGLGVIAAVSLPPATEFAGVAGG